MNAFLRGFTTTTVGLKQIVGLTGFLLAGFVLGHLLGNLQIFLGPDAINSYAANLKSLPGPLWTARVGLLAVLVAHLWGVFTLWKRNAKAREKDYNTRKPIDSTLASRSMMLTGLVILFFVGYHLAHFTFGWTDPQNYHLVDDQGRHDVYSMMALGFRQPLVSGLYIIAMGLLGLHLGHGVASLFQTAGIRTMQFRQWTDLIGRGFALLIVIGNISIPLACLAGLVEPTQGRF